MEIVTSEPNLEQLEEIVKYVQELNRRLENHEDRLNNLEFETGIFLERKSTSPAAVKPLPVVVVQPPSVSPVVIPVSSPKNLYVEYTNASRNKAGKLEETLKSSGFNITERKAATKVAFVTFGNESSKIGAVGQLKTLYDSFGGGAKNVFVIELQEDDETGGTISRLYPKGFREHETYYYNIKQNHFIDTEPIPGGGSRPVKKTSAAPLVKPPARPVVVVTKNSASLYLYIPNRGANQNVRNAIVKIAARLGFKPVEDIKNAHYLAIVGLENDFGLYKENIMNTIVDFDSDNVFLIYVTMTPGRQYQTVKEFEGYLSYTYDLAVDGFVDNEPTPDGPKEVSKSTKVVLGGPGKQQPQEKKKVVIDAEPTPNSIALYNINASKWGMRSDTYFKSIEEELQYLGFEVKRDSSDANFYGVVLYKGDYNAEGLLSNLKKELINSLFVGIVMTDVELDNLPLFVKDSYVFQWHTKEQKFLITKPSWNSQFTNRVSILRESIPRRFGPSAKVAVCYIRDRSSEDLKKFKNLLGQNNIIVVDDYKNAKVALVYLAATKNTFANLEANILKNEAVIDKNRWKVYKVVRITDAKDEDDAEFVWQLVRKGYYLV